METLTPGPAQHHREVTISVHDPTLRGGEGGLLRTRNRFINDGKQLFVKLSYLFRP